MFKLAKLKKGVQLREHQERVQRKLEYTKSLLLYHGLGTGKTLSAIAATDGDDTDIVVPASLRNNFKKQYSDFSTNINPKVISYNKATSDGGSLKGNSLILDEIHKIGNSSTKRSQKIRDLSKRYKKVILLTGTPITNHPYELGPIGDVLDPNGKFPVSRESFNDRFIKEVHTNPTFIDKVFKGIKPGSKKYAKNLKELESFFRGKVDYQESGTENFPDRIDRIVNVNMSPEQIDHYRTVTSKANPVLAAKVRKNYPLSKSEMSQLNAFMTDSRIVSNTTKPYGGKTHGKKILRAVRDLIIARRSNKNHKSLVYSNYIDGGVGAYASLLDKEKIPYHIYKGGLSDKKRKTIIDDYNSGRVKNLLLTSSGAEGLDLKGTRSIQILEPHWNNSRVEQVIGRGIRFKSHDHLPKKDRNVLVTRYHSSMPKSRWQKFTGSKADMDTDNYLYNLSKEKDVLNNQFLDALKRASIEKTASFFYHRTNNIDKVLKDGSLHSLKNLAKRYPNRLVEVEPNRWSRERKTVKASKAYKIMKKAKDTDFIFLNKGAPLRSESYGKYIIRKEIKTPKEADNINMIPWEYKQKKSISLKRKADVFAPQSEIKRLSRKYKDISFKPMSDLNVKFHEDKTMSALARKVKLNLGLVKSAAAEEITKNNYKRLLGRKAQLFGSAYLGTDIGKSDIDIMIHYKNTKSLQKARERFKNRFGLKESGLNSSSRNKVVLKKRNIDVVLTTDNKALKYIEEMKRAKRNLTSGKIFHIRKNKTSIKNSWIAPRTRYFNYKRKLDEQMGITEY